MEQDCSTERGIGPNGSSLRAKLGRPGGLVFSNPFAMQLEQQERKEQRVAATIAWSERNRTPPKPVAPIEQTDAKTTLPDAPGDRLWKWAGEAIDSKGLQPGFLYPSKQIRAAGYKLPVLVKTKTPRKPRKPKGDSREGETDGR